MKRKYLVMIRETLERGVIVEAENYAEAEEKVEEVVNNENIVLELDDFTEREIDALPIKVGIYEENKYQNINEYLEDVE